MESYEARVHSGFPGGKPDVSDPRVLAWLIRRNGLEMTHLSRGSHIGSVLSVAEIIAVLYSSVLNADPKDPKKPDRDRLILSKGHAGSAVYSALAETGFFPVEQLKTHYANGSVLSGHVSHKNVPGVEMSTGSLGHGLGIGVGMALGAKMDGASWRTYVVMGDGECDEGSVWESALQAAQYGLDRLTAVVDYNHMQSLTTVEKTLKLEPFEQKWRDFGWNAESVDGKINYTGADGKLGFGEMPGRPDFVVAVNHISRKKYPINWKIGIYRTDNAGGLGSKVNGGSPRPWNIAKFSEFYLIAAEAAVKLNNNAEAYRLVNVLRARAGKQTFCQNDNVAVSVDHSAEMVAATPATITIDYILDERSREFWGEGYRWFDLVRTQTWGDRATKYRIAGSDYTDKDLQTFTRDIPKGYYLRPIPQGQLDGMEMSDEEKALYQNPAYRN